MKTIATLFLTIVLSAVNVFADGVVFDNAALLNNTATQHSCSNAAVLSTMEESGYTFGDIDETVDIIEGLGAPHWAAENLAANLLFGYETKGCNEFRSLVDSVKNEVPTILIMTRDNISNSSSVKAEEEIAIIILPGNDSWHFEVEIKGQAPFIIDELTILHLPEGLPKGFEAGALFVHEDNTVKAGWMMKVVEVVEVVETAEAEVDEVVETEVVETEEVETSKIDFTGKTLVSRNAGIHSNTEIVVLHFDENREYTFAESIEQYEYEHGTYSYRIYVAINFHNMNRVDRLEDDLISIKFFKLDSGNQPLVHISSDRYFENRIGAAAYHLEDGMYEINTLIVSNNPEVVAEILEFVGE